MKIVISGFTRFFPDNVSLLISLKEYYNKKSKTINKEEFLDATIDYLSPSKHKSLSEFTREDI